MVDYCLSKNIGDKIKFQNDKIPYTIKAKADRYLICTRPYNFKSTVFYTIIDLKLLIRGANNLVFNIYDYKEQKDTEQCLKDLASGKVEVSSRNCIKLDVELK